MFMGSRRPRKRWARDAIYGPSQEAVTRVRRVARQNPSLLGEFRFRPPRIWVPRGKDRSGQHVFTSRYKGQTARMDRVGG